ncbi:hypothetical protein SMACR_08243 [Sordaria macrospora]|uniref:WGS project CABT00000000 data, contig 2.43 n=2 Tax=Sordaria macrospora TaxID=5147 RepID=F7W893_SORMK|nr:uncharacterized protein SMAC_08243 [Sordaria macrospora k-hell]KAA8631799.1 hypothetical protein SMACR_08243 [Sordaria macrospora]WPJ61072.1 hypothetical protein SMAC4_08243 [Sordaria macrospora]CCC13738.1 unnamed protein product [Sordaria macrospora k-hell]
MISSVITSGAVFLISLFQALPIAAFPAASKIDGYSIGDITWEIQTSPGGPVVNVTGTVQEVIKYAEKVNPNFRSDFTLD